MSALPPEVVQLREHVQEMLGCIDEELGAPLSAAASHGPLVLIYLMENLHAQSGDCLDRIAAAINQAGQLLARASTCQELANGLARMQDSLQSLLDLRREIRTLCISRKESRGLELLLGLLDHSLKEVKAWAENIVSTLGRIEAQDLQGNIQLSFTLTLTAPAGVTAELEAWGKNITALYLPERRHAPMAVSTPMPTPGPEPVLEPGVVPKPAKQKQISCFWALLGLIGLGFLWRRRE